MGKEIRWGFNPSNLQPENQANFIVDETNKGLHLKDDVAFTLLIVVCLHIVAMFNEFDNLPRLEMIFNEKPIGLRNHIG
jgi:hypothetical protein